MCIRDSRLAYSNRSGRDLLALLQRSAQAQLQVGAVLALALAFNVSL